MARKKVFEIAAVNITMHPHSPGKYVDLFRRLSRGRSAVNVRGEYQAMIGSVRDIEKDKPERGLTGEIYKFFELDPLEQWFNVVRQQAANPEEREKIQIPSDLKPHFKSFFYVFFPKGHRLFIESRYAQCRLSPGATARMLTGLFEKKEIQEEFGHIDVTVEPSAESLELILKMPKLRRFLIEVTRPNADDLNSATQKVMDRLGRLNANSETRELKVAKGESLKIDAELRTLAGVAQSNGYVEAEGTGTNGKSTLESTREHPMKRIVNYDPATEDPRERLIAESSQLLRQITSRAQSKN